MTFPWAWTTPAFPYSTWKIGHIPIKFHEQENVNLGLRSDIKNKKKSPFGENLEEQFSLFLVFIIAGRCFRSPQNQPTHSLPQSCWHSLCIKSDLKFISKYANFLFLFSLTVPKYFRGKILWVYDCNQWQHATMQNYFLSNNHNISIFTPSTSISTVSM